MTGKRAKCHRPARLVHGCDAVLPSVPYLSCHVVDRPRHEADSDAVEPDRLATAEAHGRRRAKRHPDDMPEHRAVAMPANAGARIIANEQGLNEVIDR